MSGFPLPRGSFNGRSPSFDCQRLLNLYSEATESGDSRGELVLFGAPGLALWATLTGGGVRGAIRFADYAIVVCGSNVWRVNADASSSLMGVIDGNPTVASMASNGTILMLVTGAYGYIIDPAAVTVTAIASASFAGADTVDFADGYFVFNKSGTGQFQASGLYAGTFDALDFATAEGGPDNLVSLIVDHREVWLLGQNTTEVWLNTGNPDFAFERIQGAFLEIGCAAAHSVAKADNSIFWLAIDDRGFGTVQRATGYAPQRVSNHAFEFAVAGYSRIDDAVAYTYSQEGHTFYQISFPTANATWTLDLSTGTMDERAWRDPVTGTLGRHRSNCQFLIGGNTIVGDWENGNLYRMDLDVFDDNGAPLVAQARFAHIADDANYVLHHALELTMQTGVGLSSGQGSDPQAMLRWSDDGGYTWSNEHWTTIGAIGQRKTRVRWRRLGKSRDRVYEVTITDPVRRVITGAQLQSTRCAA